MKHVIFSVIPTAFIQACPIIGGKIHAQVDDDFDHSQADYAATWDQKSPWLVVLKGDPATVVNTYAGWPTVTKAQWEAANPVKSKV